jgi:hypothetical protein
MVRITMSFENIEAVQEALRQYGERAASEIGRAVQATGLEVRSDIQRRILRGPKTGRVYLRGSVSHRASRAGEAPATDTGTLASSISYRQIDVMTAEVESRLPYATFLEFGTVNMDARPSWTPAVEAASPNLQRRVADALRGLS